MLILARWHLWAIVFAAAETSHQSDNKIVFDFKKITGLGDRDQSGKTITLRAFSGRAAVNPCRRGPEESCRRRREIDSGKILVNLPGYGFFDAIPTFVRDVSKKNLGIKTSTVINRVDSKPRFLSQEKRGFFSWGKVPIVVEG